MAESPEFAPRPVLASIHDFLQAWPDAEFGPAHIVLSDHNLEDEHVRWCLGLARAAISRAPEDLYRTDDLPFMVRMDWYHRCVREELAATVIFLEQLLNIPEPLRVAEIELDPWD